MITVRIEAAKDDDMAAIQIMNDIRNVWGDLMKAHEEGLCSQRSNFKKKLAEAQLIAKNAGYSVLVVRVYASPAGE